MWYENYYGKLVNLKHIKFIDKDSLGFIAAYFDVDHAVSLELFRDDKEFDEKMKKLSRMLAAVKISE